MVIESEILLSDLLAQLKSDRLLPIYAASNLQQGINLLKKKSSLNKDDRPINYIKLIPLDVSLPEMTNQKS